MRISQGPGCFYILSHHPISPCSTFNHFHFIDEETREQAPPSLRVTHLEKWRSPDSGVGLLSFNTYKTPVQQESPTGPKSVTKQGIMRVTESHTGLGVKDTSVHRNSRGCLWRRRVCSLEGCGQDEKRSGLGSVREGRAPEARPRVWGLTIKFASSS